MCIIGCCYSFDRHLPTQKPAGPAPITAKDSFFIRNNTNYNRNGSLSQQVKSSISTQKVVKSRVTYLTALHRTNEVVSEKLADYVYSIFYQSTDAVHAVCFPLSSVFSALGPYVVAETFSFVCDEVTNIGITCGPSIYPMAMLHALIELSFVLLSNLEIQFTTALFKIVMPKTFIDISIFILIQSLVSQIILESASKHVSIEQDELTLLFGICLPKTFKYCALTEIINTFSFFFALLKAANVLIFVCILKHSFSMWQIVYKLSRVDTAICKNQSTSAMSLATYKIANICLSMDFIIVICIPCSLSIFPLSLINFLLAVVQSFSIFFALMPSAIIVGIAIGIVVHSFSFHLASLDQTIVYLSIGMHVYSLSIEFIISPATKINIVLRVSVDALPISQFLGCKLAKVLPSIRVVDLSNIGKTFQSLNELIFAKIVGAQYLVFIGLGVSSKRHEIKIITKLKVSIYSTRIKQNHSKLKSDHANAIPQRYVRSIQSAFVEP